MKIPGVMTMKTEVMMSKRTIIILRLLGIGKVQSGFFPLCTLMNLNDMGTADHSFKIASMILASGRVGSAFTAAYNMLSGNGMININPTCHMKSNDELRPVLEQSKEVRANAGAPPLFGGFP
jgi:hypothetical protein